MPRFTFTTPEGDRTVRAADKATAQKFLERQTNHPDPTGAGSQPYTSAQLTELRNERNARAGLLTLREER